MVIMKYLTKTLILLSCFLGGSLPAFSNDFFIPKSMFLDEFPFPFQPVSIDVPDLVLNTIQNSDILFLGEKHTFSVFLEENTNYKKSESKSNRLNSLNQENIYFHLIDSFSKIHAKAKKCLWLEYSFNNPYLEDELKGLNFSTSHYYLINTAKEQGWTVFPVDNRALNDRNLRDYYMAQEIALTISEGLCEKGIAQNGMAHLSGYKDYIQKHRLKDRSSRNEYLDEILKNVLRYIGLVKTIGFFIMEEWTELIKTREDVVSALKKKETDFSGWNLRQSDLSQIDLSHTDLTRANLTGANLSEAELKQTNLWLANLTGAILRGANLSYANLSGANLSHADLTGANLTEANLYFAKYNAQTIFPDDFNPKSSDMIFIEEADLTEPKHNKQTEFPLIGFPP